MASPAEAAARVRREAGLGDRPLPALEPLVERLGVDLALHDFGSDRPDGVYHWDGRRGLIVVNTGRGPVARRRCTIAHELGHHVLHRRAGRPLEAVDADVLGPAPSGAEREADAFAGHLLAPDGALRAVVAGVEGGGGGAAVRAVAEGLGVPVRTAALRLHEAGLLPAEARDRALRGGDGHAAAAGGASAPLAPVLPRRFVRLVLELCDGGSLDEARAAELLRTDEAGVRRALARVAS